MQSTQSCLGPWSQCTIPAPKDEDNTVQDCQLEFVVNGPNDGVDKPVGRDSYVLHGPGGYKLSSGTVRPFPQACNAPYMLVSFQVHLHMLSCSDATHSISSCRSPHMLRLRHSTVPVRHCKA